MVKFSREYEAQIIPEWKAKFIDYKQLKKLIKRIKISRRSASPSVAAAVSCPDQQQQQDGSYGFSILDPIRSLFATHFSPKHAMQAPPEAGDGETFDTKELVESVDNQAKEFLERLEEELEKVNKFYDGQEAELLSRGEAVISQLHILTDIKSILQESRLRRRRQRQPFPPLPSPSPSFGSSGRHLLSGLTSPQYMSDGGKEQQQAQASEGAAVAEEVMAALERNGVSFLGAASSKAKKEGKTTKAAAQMGGTIRIDIPATSPGRAMLKVWEELVNGLRKEGAAGTAAAFVYQKKIQHAEKIIRGSFVELYRGLQLLKKYSSLNMKAFTKILKKFLKVSGKQQATDSFSEKVKGSQFSSSDKVLQLADEVECIFMRNFARNDKKVAMKYLRPQQPKDNHMITFLVGLFTGTFVTLFIVYGILGHFCGIFSSTGSSGYMETVYHVFSMFALISLHIFLYGCNLFMWKSTRINNNFIFDFSSSTALTHSDAFLICASIMSTVVTALVLNLFLRSASVSSPHADALPGALLLLSTGILVCPFNIFYRSTRYCFMRVVRNIIFSPFYKVLMADFFMADQLTSQIPLLRHLEFTACYFMAGGFKIHPYETCTTSKQYKHLAYVISFLPYYWRAMQCVRRYLEEGYDTNQLANGGKYASAMVAAAVRFKYAVEPTPFWLAVVIITSTGATIYQLYWDFVKDWGFFKLSSKNRLLRDELVLKNKSIYYVSIMINLVLRLAWIESVMRINIGLVEHRLLDFSLASLEIIRRGHWNFYRLENEHLNNVGKFRVVKIVPLPFRELEMD